MTLKELARSYLDRYPFLKQFTKFCIVGGISAIIHFSFLFSLTELVGIWYVASSAIGFIFSATFNFTTNKLWTFRNRERGKHAINQVARFVTVMIFGLIINTTIIYLLTEFIGFDYRISWIFATGVVTFWNFSLNRLWTFKYSQTSSDCL